MGDGMDEGRAAIDRTQATPRQVARVHQHQLRRAAGRADRFGCWRFCGQLQGASAVTRGVVLGERDFLKRIDGGHADAGGVEQGEVCCFGRR